ncbi:ATP-binding protein [uncultured Cohaesibacter sp.]|uniref:ATP-binding protein n=1 Tax=uncultured Cohaesibacter sp. TaxID=1002546 RepID=UPI0029C69E03|nr:ATP-binding protein [uncultured Cohaesibacter sp.]
MSISQPSSLAMPFLTLTAHPAIGAVLLDSRPAWVWNGEGNRILWSNRAGLDFFEVRSMHALLDRQFGDVHPARRHLARLARNAQADAPILDRLRFFLGDTTVTTSCLCKKLRVEGETVLLVIATEANRREEPHEERAKSLVTALAADGAIAAAFVNPDGHPWASAGEETEGLSAYWQALFRDQGRLHVMIAESNTPLRLAACTIVAEDAQGDHEARDRGYKGEQPQPLAALVRIGEQQDRHYLVLLHRPDTLDEQMAENLHLLTSELGGDDDAGGEPEGLSDREAVSLFPDIFHADARTPHADEPDLQHDSDMHPFLSDSPTKSFPGSENVKPGVSSVPSSEDRSQSSSGNVTNVVSLAPEAPKPSEESHAFDRNGGPYHFIWESDEVGRFSLVSDDLAKAVGAGHADIVGKDWPEISGWLNMDPDQKIAHAFESRDTWAGVTVHWPVEGHPLLVPVELTGLPVFGRYHGFQGFRGFGICHVDQALSGEFDEEIGKNTVNERLENTGTPQFAVTHELLSDDLLQAARAAVATTEAVISPAQGNGLEDNEDHRAEDEGTPVSEDRKDPLEETAKADDTAFDAETGDTDHPAAKRLSLPRNPYDLVTSLLQPPEPDSEEEQLQAPDPGQDDASEVVSKDEPLALSIGERSAFDSIAAVLKNNARPRLDDSDDMDDDYEELETFDDLGEDYEDEFEPDDTLTAVTALSEEAASLMQEPDAYVEPAQTTEPDGAVEIETAQQPDHIHEAESVVETVPQPPVHDDSILPTSSKQETRRDSVLRSAASAAFREIMALDPTFKSLRERTASRHEPEPDTHSEPETAAVIDEQPEGDMAAPLLDAPVESETRDDLETEFDAAQVQADLDEGTKELQDEVSLTEPDAELIEPEGIEEPVEETPADQETFADEPKEDEPDEALSSEMDIAEDEVEQEIEVDTSAQESSTALAAATIAGVAALGGPALWDRKAAASPLIDLLNKIPTAILVSANSEILFASRKALRALGYESAAALEEAGGMEGLFAGRPGDWLTKTDGRTTLRGADHVHRSVLACISSINWGERPAAMLTFEAAPDTPPGMGVSEEDEKIAELEAILDTATDGVVVLDETGHILRMNHSAEALFEVDRHEIAGNSFLDLIMEESHKDVLDYLNRLKSHGFASLLNDGRDIIGRVRTGGMIPLFMTMGRVAIPGTNRFCAVLRDVTDWKRTEETMLTEKLKAESASKQKSEFLTRVSHEIRTPLNAILGFSEVMMEEQFGPIGSERYKDYLKDISISGNHIMALLNDIMDLSKVESGKLDLNFEATQLNRLVAESVGIMQPQANREQIIFRTSLASDLPDIAGDDRSLRQVVLNLLSNALKFTPAGGQVIVSTLQEESGDVVLRIRDTGIGMSEDDIQSALEPFRQLATSRKDDGIGLGLPLTKALVEANRGRMRLSSKEKHGTLVEVTFPKKRVIEAEAKTEEAETLV